MSSSTLVAPPPNHHAGHPGFAGLSGLAAGLTMIVGRGAVGRLACDLTAVSPADHVVDLGCGPGVAASAGQGPRRYCAVAAGRCRTVRSRRKST